MGSEIPEWAEKIAGGLALDYVDWLGRNKVDADAEHVLTSVIAGALVAAERRGIEQAIDAAEAHEISVPLGIGLADGASMARNQILFSIRQLGGTP